MHFHIFKPFINWNSSLYKCLLNQSLKGNITAIIQQQQQRSVTRLVMPPATTSEGAQKQDAVEESTASAESAATNSKHDQESRTTMVELDGVTYAKVKEGDAEVLFPSAYGVFYNPVQEFNRDISVCILRLFATEYQNGCKDEKKRKRQEAYFKSLANGGLKSSPETTPEPEETTQQSSETSQQLAQSTQHSLESTQASAQSPHPADPKETVSPSCTEDSSDSSRTPSPTEEPFAGTVHFPKAKVWHENGLRILEALSASGLRSIRYANEVGGIKEIIANDLSAKAVECIQRNIEYNNLTHLITASESDASLLLYHNRPSTGVQFDVVDLDPYGSPAQFLDGAVQAVAEGGLLMVTCTDMAVLCGNSPETCHAKYGATSIKSKACHEMALRIVLQSIEAHANRYGRYIVPLISISVDFYIRMAVRVYTSPLKVKESYTKRGLVYHCVGCGTTTLQPMGRIEVNGRSVRHKLPHGPPVGERCQHCNARHQVGGPIWLPPIHDQQFLQRMVTHLSESGINGTSPLGTERRILGMVHMMLEELPDVPLYYIHENLCGVVGTSAGKLVRFKSALLNAGYRVSMSHCQQNSIKTDAPASVLWDIVRAHEISMPSRRIRGDKHCPGYGILNKAGGSDIAVDFTPHPDAVPESGQKGMLRFQVKPEKFWGPASRNSTRVLGTSQQKKKLKNQGRSAHKKQDKPDTEEVTMENKENPTEEQEQSDNRMDISEQTTEEEMEDVQCDTLIQPKESKRVKLDDSAKDFITR